MTRKREARLRPVAAKGGGETSDKELDERRAYWIKKLEEMRKSCEYLATFAAATVYGNTIKVTPGALRPVILGACAASVMASLAGATSWFLDGRTLSKLRRRLIVRFWFRNGALLALAVALAAMVADAWNPPAPPACTAVPCYVAGPTTAGAAADTVPSIAPALPPQP